MRPTISRSRRVAIARSSATDACLTHRPSDRICAVLARAFSRHRTDRHMLPSRSPLSCAFPLDATGAVVRRPAVMMLPEKRNGAAMWLKRYLHHSSHSRPIVHPVAVFSAASACRFHAAGLFIPFAMRLAPCAISLRHPVAPQGCT